MTSHLTISQFFGRSVVYSVPPYHRAYVWEDEQLQALYDDIVSQPADRAYFLGAILLEENSELDGCVNFNIVDGQQRLTTTVIFVGELLAAMELEGKGNDVACRKARRAYIMDEGIPKFRTIADDEAFFDSYIRKTSQWNGSFSTLSQERLWNAKTFFCNKLKGATVDHLFFLLSIINESRIITYTVDTPGEAIQLFERNNARGKRLTDLDKLKNHLTHNV